MLKLDKFSEIWEGVFNLVLQSGIAVWYCLIGIAQFGIQA